MCDFLFWTRGVWFVLFCVSGFGLLLQRRTDLWPLVILASTAGAIGIWPYDAEQERHRHKSKARAMIVGIGTPLVVGIFCLLEYCQNHR